MITCDGLIVLMPPDDGTDCDWVDASTLGLALASK